MAGRNNFIERSIMSALSFLKEAVFAEEYALKKGLLQSLDPRVRAATILLLIVAALLVKNIFALLFLYSICLLLSILSGIRLGFFLKRTWIFIPLFSLFIAIPALFSIFTPGDALFTWHLAGWQLTVTRQGLSGAVLFVMRVATSVSLAVLLSITTRHFELLRALRAFRIPRLFVMTLGMCYRYVFLFAEIVENTYLAIKSRVGSKVHYKRGQHIVTWNIANLWLRSYKLNEEVYKAMLSRGYGGESLILQDFKLRIRDWLWLFVVAIISLWTISFSS